MKRAFKLLPLALLAASMTAQAALTITIQEVGHDLVLSGSGSINSAIGLPSSDYAALTVDRLAPAEGFVLAGTSAQPNMKTFGFLHTGPNSFGTGTDTEAETGTEKAQSTNNTGNLFGFHAQSAPGFGLVYLPSDYVSGTALQFSSTFKITKLTDLGIELGDFTWTLNSPFQPVSDSITLKVIPAAVTAAPATATPVPGLGVFALIGLAGAMGAAGGITMSRKRKPN